MADQKLPALQFYPGDWRKDPAVQALDYHHRGIWFEVLMLMHESDDRGRLTLNGRPMPDPAAARLLSLTVDEWRSARHTLLEFGVASEDTDGALINRRMVKDEDIRTKRTRAGKAGGRASARARAESNDRSTIGKQKSSKHPSKGPSKPGAGKPNNGAGFQDIGPSKPEASAKQKPTPSVSSSSSASSSEEEIQPPATPPETGTAGAEARREGGRLSEHDERGAHPDTERLWVGGLREAVHRIWHHGQERVRLGDKTVGIGLEHALLSDLLWAADGDTEFVTWLVAQAPKVLGWDSEPRTLYWAIRPENFHAAESEFRKGERPAGIVDQLGVSLKRIPSGSGEDLRPAARRRLEEARRAVP